MYSFVFSQASSRVSKSSISVYCEYSSSKRHLLVLVGSTVIRPMILPFLLIIHLSPSGCVRRFNSCPSTISFLMISIDFVYYMGNRVRNQNRVRYLNRVRITEPCPLLVRNIILQPFRSSSSHCHSRYHQPSAILIPSSYSRSPLSFDTTYLRL